MAQIKNKIGSRAYLAESYTYMIDKANSDAQSVGLYGNFSPDREALLSRARRLARQHGCGDYQATEVARMAALTANL